MTWSSHSASSIARLIPAGILKPLDKAKLPNMKHMMPEIMEQLDSKWDPGNSHIVPYMWGTHGVTYNRELVLETYPDAPIGSMDLVLDPAHMKEVAKCGVVLPGLPPTTIIPMALTYLGLPPDSTNRKDYAKVKETLLAVRPYIKTFDNYAYQRMPQREFCIAVTWGPDGLLAMSGRGGSQDRGGARLLLCHRATGKRTCGPTAGSCPPTPGTWRRRTSSSTT